MTQRKITAADLRRLRKFVDKVCDLALEASPKDLATFGFQGLATAATELFVGQCADASREAFLRLMGDLYDEVAEQLCDDCRKQRRLH